MFFSIALLLLVIISVVIIYKVYYGILPKIQWISGALLRIFVGILIAILVINPYCTKFKESIKKPSILVVIDNSLSMNRYFTSNQAQKILEVITGIIHERFKDSFNVILGKFDTNFYLNGDINFSGGLTNLSSFVDFLRGTHKALRVQLAIVITDGNHNVSEDFELTHTEGLPKIIAISPDTINEQNFVEILRINVPEEVPPQKNIPVEVWLKAQTANDDILKAKVYINNLLHLSKEFPLKRGGNFFRLPFQIKSQDSGFIRIQVNAEVYGKKNNLVVQSSKIQIVRIAKKKVTVVIIAGAPHPDVSAIYSAIKMNHDYDVSLNVYPDPIPKELTISGNVIFIFIHPENERKKLLNEFSGKYPLLLISKYKVDKDERAHFYGQIQEITPYKFYKDFAFLRISSYVDLLPPLLSEGRNIQTDIILVSGRGSQVKSEVPLIYIRTASGFPLIEIAGENIWRWRTYLSRISGNHEIFDEFINKLLSMLTGEVASNKMIINVPSLIFAESSFPVSIQVIKEKDILRDALVSAYIYDSAGKKSTVSFLEDNGNYTATFPALPQGKYFVQFSAQKDNFYLFSQKILNIMSRELEKDSTANFLNLMKLAGISGGKVLSLNNLEELSKEFNQIKSSPEINFTESKEYLSQNIIFLLLIVGVLSLEWFLRKKIEI